MVVNDALVADVSTRFTLSSSAMRPAEARAAAAHCGIAVHHRERRQRLPHLELLVVAQLAPQAHDARARRSMRSSSAVSMRPAIGLGIVAEVHAGGRRRVDRAHQVLVHVLASRTA